MRLRPPVWTRGWVQALCPAGREVEAQCALQLRRIGDKWDLRQKFLNLLTKLFFPET
ncbi:PREDICTED: phorbol-12-myristate-13-acetate-induced protein 1 [Haliaeetus leucocephalus]|uniref:phorbol-12-myristate-13-acetate-induced protein 1 n=1 Tax=Haliaeetus leucocephalus TaxID=52644 RepID=UPI00053CB2A7|nr:PREDICTED: phorbol-12-myristate-13-acetate-induced protein 1 [Haliaeetus leucocephalus]